MTKNDLPGVTRLTYQGDGICRRSMYHVTLTENMPSILKSGIRPSVSRGGVYGAWYCDNRGVEQAIKHVARKRKCSVMDLSVCGVYDYTTCFIGCNNHYYVTVAVLFPVYVCNAFRYIQEKRGIYRFGDDICTDNLQAQYRVHHDELSDCERNQTAKQLEINSIIVGD